MYYQRGRAHVKGMRLDGSYGDIDVVDLDSVSFHAWVLDRLCALWGESSQIRREGSGEALPYRQRQPEMRRPARPGD